MSPFTIDSRSPERTEDKNIRPDVRDDLFKGRTFAVTGIFNKITRDEMEHFITSKRGRLAHQITGSVEFLIAGHRLEDGREVHSSSKYRNAMKIPRVRILNETLFEEYIKK